MSRQPDRSRSRRIVLAVLLFLLVVTATRDEECGRRAPLATATALATVGLLPKLSAVFLRALVLVSQPGKANEARCPARR